MIYRKTWAVASTCKGLPRVTYLSKITSRKANVGCVCSIGTIYPFLTGEESRLCRRHVTVMSQSGHVIFQLQFQVKYPSLPCLQRRCSFNLKENILSFLVRFCFFFLQEVAKMESAMTIAAICARFDVALAPGQVIFLRIPNWLDLLMKRR